MTPATILRSWIALVVLLAATTAIAFAPLGSLNLGISIGIATAKALIILIFFMELRGSRALVRTFAAAGFFWLFIMIVMTAADYTHRTDAHAPLDAVRQ